MLLQLSALVFVPFFIYLFESNSLKHSPTLLIKGIDICLNSIHTYQYSMAYASVLVIRLHSYTKAGNLHDQTHLVVKSA